jgi:hypothetical protein
MGSGCQLRYPKSARNRDYLRFLGVYLEGIPVLILL